MNGRAAAVCLGIGIVAGVWLFSALSTLTAGFNPEEAGLGRNTLTRTAYFEGHKVADQRTNELAKSALFFRGQGRTTALMLGASQLHAINRLKTGDELAVFHANRSAEARGSNMRYVQVSLGNGNFNEFLAIYLSLRQRGFVPDWLVVAAVYDDLRETGTRREIINEMGQIPNDLVARGGKGIQGLAEEYRKVKVDEQPERSAVARSVNVGTPQDRAESSLVRFMERRWPAYRDRGKIEAAAEVGVRGMIAGLLGASMSRRAAPIPPDMQVWNMTALDGLIALARADGVKILLYQQPHRPGERVFYYDRAAYDEWHASLKTRSEKEGVDCLQLETIVPEPLWGETNEGRPDVFHFQGEGHRILGKALDEYFATAGL